LSVEAELKRAVRRLNLILIVLAVELIPIALLAIYFLAMFLSHPLLPQGIEATIARQELVISMEREGRLCA